MLVIKTNIKVYFHLAGVATSVQNWVGAATPLWFWVYYQLNYKALYKYLISLADNNVQSSFQISSIDLFTSTKSLIANMRKQIFRN